MVIKLLGTHSITALFLVAFCSASWSAAPDEVTKEIEIGLGSTPAIAIDPERKIIHLIYGQGSKLKYRAWKIGTNIGQEEDVASASVFDPKILLDKNGDPHVVASTGIYAGSSVWYSNRIGGKWKNIIAVLPSSCGLREKDRAITPSIAIDNDMTVYVSAFMGCLASIKNISEIPTPATVRKGTGWWGHSSLFSRPNGELWVFKGEPYGFQKLDKATLKETGNFTKVSTCGAEQFRASMDALGDLHAAGGCIGSNSTNRGWYNSLSRAQSGKDMIKYNTTNGHENGAAMPIPDLATKGRVYIAYFTGGSTDRYGVNTGCISDNKLSFARIDDGKLSSQGNTAFNRSGQKTKNYRSTPAVAALPGGGVILAGDDCGTNKIYLAIVGNDMDTGSLSVHSARNVSNQPAFNKNVTEPLKMYNAAGRQSELHN